MKAGAELTASDIAARITKAPKHSFDYLIRELERGLPPRPRKDRKAPKTEFATSSVAFDVLHSDRPRWPGRHRPSRIHADWRTFMAGIRRFLAGDLTDSERAVFRVTLIKLARNPSKQPSATSCHELIARYARLKGVDPPSEWAVRRDRKSVLEKYQNFDPEDP